MTLAPHDTRQPSFAETALAGDCICQDFTRSLTGKHPSDRDFRAVTKLGESVRDGGFSAIAGLHAGEILMQYDN